MLSQVVNHQRQSPFKKPPIFQNNNHRKPIQFKTNDDLDYKIQECVERSLSQVDVLQQLRARSKDKYFINIIQAKQDKMDSGSYLNIQQTLIRNNNNFELLFQETIQKSRQITQKYKWE